MSYLYEDSRTQLLNKSKTSQKGMDRFRKRLKSKVSNTVKNYNSINMDKMFKDGIVTVDISVKGETDFYNVKISFGGFLDLLHEQIEQQNKFDLKAITRALINGFNREDVYVNCNCGDAKYRHAFWQTKNKTNSGKPELRPSNITNPNDSLGAGCKHVLLVLSNTSWVIKTASTIYNYVRYMEGHYQALFAKIIFPAIYQTEYTKDYQTTLFDTKLVDDKTTLDAANTYAKTRTQFKKDNPYRFKPVLKTKNQLIITDEEPEESNEQKIGSNLNPEEETN